MAEIKIAKPADAIDEAEEDAAIEDDADGDTPKKDDSSALLDMFTEVGIETVDRSLLTGLAGEVDMVDLIAELNVVAAAMGIVRAQHDTVVHEDVEQLAA